MIVTPARGSGAGGFSLIETLVAMGLLATVLVGLAGVFSVGMSHLAGSSASLIAREKAREAIESVHSARDIRTISWDQLRNVAAGGVFLDGPQPLRTAGADGLVNTADDQELETALSTGPDDILGTADDVESPLTQYSREIEISAIPGGTNANLRQLTVTIRFAAGAVNRRYVLTTYISSTS